MLVFPSDPVFERRIDPVFAVERSVARELGLSTALISHDEIEAGNPDASVDAIRNAGSSQKVVYRGWMIEPSNYLKFEEKLLSAGLDLLTSSAAYREAHQLPGWYSAFEDFTPESAYAATFEEVEGYFAQGPVILKDFTKSMKHYWNEACFIPDIGERAHARRVAAQFTELRGAVSGGYVLRRFENFVGTEVRSWWVEGKHVLNTPHPDTPNEAVDDVYTDLGFLGEAVNTLQSRFVTVDLSLRSDGAVRVVEVGDGQVSDIPRDEGSLTVLLSALQKATQ
jgi:hypothetical protein